MFRNIKIRKSFGALIKVIVFIGVCAVLYAQLKKISVSDFDQLEIINWSYLIIATALVVVNWGIEFLKWLLITRPLMENKSNKLLARSLLAGIATGIITPNRIGNFLGRMLYFNGRKRTFAALGTLYGNLAQFIATLIFGAIGFYAVGDTLLGAENYDILKIVLVALLCISLFIYIVFPYGPDIFKLIYRKHQNAMTTLREQLRHISFFLLSLSLLRYIVFISQYGFLLLTFGANYSEDLISALYLHFVITSILPSLIMGKLVIRETVALVVLGSFISNSAIIIVASLTLWIINLGLPALAGLYFLLKKRIANVT